MIRTASPEDAERLCSIYNPYISGTAITFEESPVSEEEMRRRVGEITAILPWLILEQDGVAVGYAYASPWRSRSAYRHSVETTVYLDQDYRGEGFGTQLYEDLIQRLTNSGIHCIVGGIALPNAASVALHEKLGFRKVAQFEQIGLQFPRSLPGPASSQWKNLARGLL